MALAPGARFGPHEIVGALGAGGMGEVYRTHDRRLGPRPTRAAAAPLTILANWTAELHR